MTDSGRRVPTQTRDHAPAGLRRGNFQGTPPRGRSRAAEEAAMAAIDSHWFSTSRYTRTARVTAVDVLTATGTVRVRLEVSDGQLFDFKPGQFIGVEANFDGRGFRRSPYCMLSDPGDAPTFDLLVQAIPTGPLSLYLADLQPGERGRVPGADGPVHDPARRRPRAGPVGHLAG